MPTLYEFWLAKRIEGLDAETGEITMWSPPKLMPRQKIQEDNYVQPGMWQVLDKNPDGMNDWMHKQVVRSDPDTFTIKSRAPVVSVKKE